MVNTHAVTPNFFAVLGARALLGEATVSTPPGGRPPAVISHRLWQRSFGGDTGIIGRTVMLNQHAFTVAGVMPSALTEGRRGFFCDVWIGTDAWFETLGNRAERDQPNGSFEIMVRLLRPDRNPRDVAARLHRGRADHRHYSRE